MTSAESPEALSAPRFPDFIIAGAMKCGTTSLRHILSQHPGVYMPDFEIFYFALDDIQQHPQFFRQLDGEWRYHDVEGRREEYRRWYASFFEAARPDQLVGENSTSYIASKAALRRIATDLPKARIIVMLRDPVRRAYSHYWHLVRTGRTAVGFENCLQFSSSQVVGRSCYRQQVEHLLATTPREQVLFIVFERFVSEMPATVATTLEFLGLPGAIDLDAVSTRRNTGRYPRSVGLELMRNRFLGGPAKRVPRHLPDIGISERRRAGARGVMSRIARRLNPRHREAPPMAPGTWRFLTAYLQRENRGLSELIGQDVDAYWWKGAR